VPPAGQKVHFFLRGALFAPLLSSDDVQVTACGGSGSVGFAPAAKPAGRFDAKTRQDPGFQRSCQTKSRLKRTAGENQPPVGRCGFDNRRADMVFSQKKGNRE